MARLFRRKNGSQRRGKEQHLSFWPNITGQGGDPHITFRDKTTGEWLWLEFDSRTEVLELLSQAHIVHHNFEGAHDSDQADVGSTEVS